MPRTKRLLLVASAGGHWAELLRMRAAFDGHTTLYASTVHGPTPPTGDTPVTVLSDASRNTPLKVLRLTLQLLKLILRFRPDMVVTTGAAPGLVALYLGKLFGARTIWIDSLANPESISLSGRFARIAADLWLTQWPHLTARYPDLKYYGAVFDSGSDRPQPKRLLLVASAGGHWVQLSRMHSAFEGHITLYASTMKGMRPPSGIDPVAVVANASRSTPLKMLTLTAQLFVLTARFRPHMVISTGAAPGLIALYLGKLFGARTIWIDSIANSESLSLSGRIAGNAADLWLTQWPHLTARYPNLKSYGGVF